MIVRLPAQLSLYVLGFLDVPDLKEAAKIGPAWKKLVVVVVVVVVGWC